MSRYATHVCPNPKLFRLGWSFADGQPWARRRESLLGKSSRAERERLVGINYRKVQPSKIQPRVCALAFEIASLKYENYCPWLRSVSLATCITSAFLIFQASFLSTAGIHAAIGIAIARARENLAFRCYTTSVTNARTACAVCFDLFDLAGENISSHGQFVRVNQLAKNEPFDISPFFLPELSARCVRACVHTCVHACVRSFRVASCGSLTFELSNRLEATTVSEYRPVIALGYGSCRLTRRVVLGAELI